MILEFNLVNKSNIKNYLNFIINLIFLTIFISIINWLEITYIKDQKEYNVL